MKPMLDPKRDLAGATPETLARALLRRVEPLRLKRRRNTKDKKGSSKPPHSRLSK